MTTTLFYNDTLASLTIASRVVRTLSLARGSGVVTKTDNSAATSIISVTDNGSTPLVFAIRVNGFTSTATSYNYNHWGRESNAMANFGAGVSSVDVYDNSGTLRFSIANTSSPSLEYGTSAAVKVTTGTGVSQTVDDGDWIVVKPAHLQAGTGASGYTLDFNYNGTSAAANGDAYVDFPDTFTEYSAPAAPPPPRSTPYPQLLAH